MAPPLYHIQGSCGLLQPCPLLRTVPPVINDINSAPKLSYNYIHSYCGLLDSSHTVGAAFDVDEPVLFFLCCAVLYPTPPQHLMIFITLLCGRSAPIMVFIVGLWLIRLLPHCFEVDEPFPLLYCTVPPPQHLMIFIALLCGRSAPIMVFIVVMWLIRLLPHCFDVDELFPLLYCTPLPPST